MDSLMNILRLNCSKTVVRPIFIVFYIFEKKSEQLMTVMQFKHLEFVSCYFTEKLKVSRTPIIWKDRKNIVTYIFF